MTPDSLRNRRHCLLFPQSLSTVPLYADESDCGKSNFLFQHLSACRYFIDTLRQTAAPVRCGFCLLNEKENRRARRRWRDIRQNRHALPPLCSLHAGVTSFFLFFAFLVFPVFGTRQRAVLSPRPVPAKSRFFLCTFSPKRD